MNLKEADRRASIAPIMLGPELHCNNVHQKLIRDVFIKERVSLDAV